MPTAWTSDLVSDELRRRLQFALIVVMSLCIARHMWLARYAHPMADDLSYARKDVSQGPLAAAVWEYEHWNGRYSSNFLVLFGPLRDGLAAINTYRLVPVLLILATLASTFAFLQACCRPWLPVRDVLTGSLVWTTLYMHAMPDIAEGFYWYTAAVTYQLAIVLAMLYLTVVVRMLRNPSPWLLPVGVLLLAIVMGFNEVMMLLLVVVHGSVVAIALWRKKAVPVRCWLLLATVLIGATAMIIAPGNAQRSAYFSGSHRLFPSLGMSLLQTARFGAIWLSSPAVLGLGALYILAHDRLSVRIPALGAGFGLKPWMTLLALPTVLTSVCVPRLLEHRHPRAISHHQRRLLLPHPPRFPAPLRVDVPFCSSALGLSLAKCTGADHRRGVRMRGAALPAQWPSREHGHLHGPCGTQR